MSRGGCSEEKMRNRKKILKGLLVARDKNLRTFEGCDKASLMRITNELHSIACEYQMSCIHVHANCCPIQG